MQETKVIQITGGCDRMGGRKIVDGFRFGNCALSQPRSVSCPKFLVNIAKGHKKILRLTTPKLESVWGPFRSG